MSQFKSVDTHGAGPPIQVPADSKPTPGQWLLDLTKNGVADPAGIPVRVKGHKVATVHINAAGTYEHARLIVEAGTVHHETGLTPQQLREQRDELLAAHEMNARLLALVLHDLQGRVDASKIGAISQCLDRSRAALAKLGER